MSHERTSDRRDERTRFEEIYYQYRNLMFYVANQILENEQDAEDAVQDAFLKLVQLGEELPEPGSSQAKSLVCIVTKHKAIDLYRRRRRQAEEPLDSEETVSQQDDIEAMIENHVFQDNMGRLPARYRELLLLKYDNGFSEREIAGLLSMTAANVHKTVQRARAKLAAIFRETTGQG